MSYILGVTQLSGCSKVENYKTYEKQVQVTPFYCMQYIPKYVHLALID